MSDGSGGTLSSASNDADQNMSASPAGSACSTCGSPPDSSSPSSQTVTPTKTHWVAIQLLDEEGHAVPNEDYRITLPDGTVVEDTLDKKGRAKIKGIDPGNCTVTFPNLDKDIWKHG